MVGMAQRSWVPSRAPRRGQRRRESAGPLTRPVRTPELGCRRKARRHAWGEPPPREVPALPGVCTQSPEGRGDRRSAALAEPQQEAEATRMQPAGCARAGGRGQAGPHPCKQPGRPPRPQSHP